MDPGTAAIVATIISGAIQSGMEWNMSKRRAKQLKRESYADVLNSTLQRQAELAEHGLQTSKKIGTGKARGLVETASTFRDIFK
ncbi:MAG TPA: hypothetical protein VFO37_04865 [Chitinophagaceae bacterium]|nr:hypothetical protein [Chitinophagaceae bacterium]